MEEETLLRYLIGKASTAELNQISEWLSENESNAKKLFEMETLWRMKDEQKYSQTDILDKAFDKFTQRNIETRTPEKGSRKYLIPSWLKYAAAIVVASLLSISIYQASTKVSPTYNIMEVPRGQRAKLTLSDGSIVWLNSGSKLSYPDHFGSQSRNVELNGEAFFEVKKDQKHPFIVNSKQIDITVLGTVFNVKAYDDDETVSVVLKQGSVQVESKDKNQKLVMIPNQQVIYANNTMNLISDSDSQRSSSWLKGELYFEEETLDNIVKSLERKFDVTITILNPSLKESQFTCRVQQNTPLEGILELLKSTRRINYKIEESNVIIF